MEEGHGHSERTQLKPLWNFDRTDGRDELNFSEFPLSAIASRVPDGQKTLVFEDQIWDEGRGEKVSRKLTVSGSDQFGLPTAIDNDVLLALIHLTKCRTNFAERTVNFSRYELVRFLQWDDGGKSYRRLEQSLNVLASVTLFYNRAWWDKGGKSWRNRTFHILESVELRGKDSRGESEQQTSSITWNGVVFESFTANYIKKLNLEVYFELESTAARQAYRFLDKRFYHKRRLEFDLKTFAFEHLGFSRSYDIGQLKRKLEPALLELERIGFLKPMTRDERFTKRGPGEWTITVEHAEKVARAKTLAAVSPESQLLVDRGVTPAVAEELVASFTKEEIRTQVAAFDALLKKGRKQIANPAGFLVQSIRGAYAHKRVEGEQKPVTQPTPKVETVHVDPNRTAREAFWESLSVAEREGVEKEAFGQAEPLLRDGLERSVQSKAESRVQAYRQTILDQHLDRLLAQGTFLRQAS